jgi:hypothetical protein
MKFQSIALLFASIILLAQSVPVQGAGRKNAAAGSTPKSNAPTDPVYLPLVFKFPVYPASCSTAPSLTSPANGSQVNSLIPLFQWDGGSNPNATEFYMEVYLDPGLTDWVYGLRTPFGAQGADDWLINMNLDASTTYYWRAYLMCGADQGPYSPTWSFTTGHGGVILPAPIPQSPPDKSTLAGTSADLKWSAVSGSVQYQVSYSGGGWDRGRILSATQTTLTLLDPSTTYDWWVQGRNDYAWGDESTHWQFTTGAAGSAGITSPPYPALWTGWVWNRQNHVDLCGWRPGC